MAAFKLIALDPGHFHAALVQKQMYPGVSNRVHVYAPLGPDVLAHLARIAGFNSRPVQPTAWDMEVHCSADFLERLSTERPGNVVVLAGRNHVKIDYIRAAIEAGFHVLADKPWIIRAEDLPKMADALDTADRSGLIAFDIMTERYEITSILQKALVNDESVFGSIEQGSASEPAVEMASVHHLMKTVAGVPLLRPAWFFDIDQQGEGLSDVGPHLADMVQWTLFPEQALDYRADIRLIEAARWPTALSVEEFRRVIDVDLVGVFLGCKVVVPHMIANGYGRIVNVASVAGRGSDHVEPLSSEYAVKMSVVPFSIITSGG